jgi:hypothetical protein
MMGSHHHERGEDADAQEDRSRQSTDDQSMIRPGPRKRMAC